MCTVTVYTGMDFNFILEMHWIIMCTLDVSVRFSVFLYVFVRDISILFRDLIGEGICIFNLFLAIFDLVYFFFFGCAWMSEIFDCCDSSQIQLNQTINHSHITYYSMAYQNSTNSTFRAAQHICSTVSDRGSQSQSCWICVKRCSEVADWLPVTAPWGEPAGCGSGGGCWRGP